MHPGFANKESNGNTRNASERAATVSRQMTSTGAREESANGRALTARMSACVGEGVCAHTTSKVGAVFVKNFHKRESIFVRS